MTSLEIWFQRTKLNTRTIEKMLDETFLQLGTTSIDIY